MGVGAAEAGKYVAGLDLVRQTLMIPAMSAAAAFFPLAVQIHARQGNAAVRSHLAECVELLLGITLPACLGFAVISPHIANVILGADFREVAAQAMPIVAIAVIFQVLTQQYLHASFLLSGRNSLYLINTASIIAANVILSYVLVSHNGTIGAAWARLGADVMNMSVSSSSMRKGETLIDTAVTLNAMHPDILVVRHHASGAVELLARKVDGSVINAGDGAHEHPTQALLDALTIRRNKGRLEGLVIAICGDVMHSRVARSNILLLNTMGARVRVVAPSTLLPRGIERMGVEVARDMREGLNGADIVMMLRLQRERMNGSFVPSTQEYFNYFGLDQKKLAYAKPDALVMHPGPMNRGVEIDSIVADGAQSLIREQVEMGVAVRMAVLEALARNLPNA